MKTNFVNHSNAGCSSMAWYFTWPVSYILHRSFPPFSFSHNPKTTHFSNAKFQFVWYFTPFNISNSFHFLSSWWLVTDLKMLLTSSSSTLQFLLPLNRTWSILLTIVWISWCRHSAILAILANLNAELQTAKLKSKRYKVRLIDQSPGSPWCCWEDSRCRSQKELQNSQEVVHLLEENEEMGSFVRSFMFFKNICFL